MGEILKTVEHQLRPAHTALFVVDMQNDFCAPEGYQARRRGHDVSQCKTIAQNIDTLAGACRAAGMPVFWIRAVYDFKYLNDAQRTKRGEEGCCLEGSWGADFYEIRPEAGEPVIDKHSFDAFEGTDLDAQLRSRGVKTLIMTGVATNVCVDSTLRDGFFKGYNIVVAEDCVGSNNKAGHEGTLTTVRTNFGSVMPSAEIAALFATRAA